MQYDTYDVKKPRIHLRIYRASGNGPAAPVLAGPVFLKVKMKFNFTKSN